MEFKDRIKKLREENGMTYTELGAMFGKTESATRAWELSRSKPDADTLIKLAKHFDCTTDYLLGLSKFRNAEKQNDFNGKLERINSKVDIADEEAGESLLEIIEALADGYADIMEYEETTLFNLMKSCYLTTVRELVSAVVVTTTIPAKMLQLSLVLANPDLLDGVSEKEKIVSVAKESQVITTKYLSYVETHGITVIREYFSTIGKFANSAGLTEDVLNDISNSFSALINQNLVDISEMMSNLRGSNATQESGVDVGTKE